MKRNRFSGEQIAAVLRDHDAGMKLTDLCEVHGISAAAVYGWKAKRDAMAGAVKLKAVEEENIQLRRLLADAMLDNVLLKEAARR